MDTKCVKGIPIKRTPLFKLQKLEGISGQFGNQNWADGKISIFFLEKMETSRN